MLTNQCLMIRKKTIKLINATGVAVAMVSSAFFLGCADLKSGNNGQSSNGGRVEFSREFSPSEGMVKGPETETRQELCLNGRWDFQPIYGPYDEKRTPPYGIDADDGGKALAPDLPQPTKDGWSETKIKIPSSWNSIAEYPSYPEKWAQAQMGWLRKKFTLPADWNNKRIIIDFQAVSGETKIFLNGEEIGTNFDSVLPFRFDITDKVRKGAENEIMVGIRGRGFFNWQGTYGNITIPPGGPGLGMWQDVYLLALPEVYVSDVYVKPEVSENRLSAEITIQNTTSENKTVDVSADVKEWLNLAGKGALDAPEIKWKLGKKVLETAPVEATIPANQESVITLQAKVDGHLKYWDFSSPNLYGMTVSVASDKQVVDKKYQRFGWREFKISGKNFLLNGKKIQLLGDSQHMQNPTYLSRRFAWSWFTLLKDVGGNAARLHAMVWPEYVHDMADQMGIALLPESSIYASSCDLNYDSALFWKVANNNVRGMVEKYRNHPSVFGWSIENEALPALNVKCTDSAYKRMVYDKFDKIADICRQLDPTRGWISGDGSQDEGGKLPIFSEHYGSTDTYLRESAATGKPYGVGEACIAYYATPRQSEMYVGDRAYRSYKDHADGIAIDAYELLKTERQVCVYCSIWNIGYYGVEELPVGLSDISKTPTRDDGVFLTTPYVEGKPGIQLERIPPYAVQYNPGYDPRYPLYKPQPLFYAAKAAYHQPMPEACEWDHRETFTNPPPPVIVNPTDEVLFYGQEDGDLFFKLKSVGIPLVMQSSAAKMIIVDCNSTNMDSALAAKIKNAVEAGATAIFWGLTPDNQSQFVSALPSSLEVFSRAASSLVPNEQDNRVASIPYKDLYFTENTDSKVIMKYALKGSFVENGNVLLKACPVDWAKNKTEGIRRSEIENPDGPSFVEVKDGAGSYIASTIDLEVISPAHIRMMSQLFKNLGVEIKPVQVKRGSLFDQTSVLTRTLIAGFKADKLEDAIKIDLVGGETSIEPEYEMTSGDSTWNVEEAKDGFFNFNGRRNDANAKNNVIYLSFWVQCPQPLNEIMADPNVPEVDFKFSAAGGSKVWLNGQEKFASPQSANNAVIEKLPLIKGWNHFLVKVVKSDGDWSFTGRLMSKNFALLSSMNSALNPHSEKANFYTINFTDPEINYDPSWNLNGDGWYQSFTPGSKAKFKFYGTGVSLTGKVGPDGGTAKLYIDGKFEQVIDYKRDLANPHAQIFSKSGFRDGEHEVMVEAIEGRVTVGSYDQWESYK
jgi:Glycosyl hydrolases family 2, sugar binding domain/Glycosyl hydrolases family 2/Glycosyl hydrolases family 2, TIM barrel domain